MQSGDSSRPQSVHFGFLHDAARLARKIILEMPPHTPFGAEQAQHILHRTASVSGGGLLGATGAILLNSHGDRDRAVFAQVEFDGGNWVRSSTREVKKSARPADDGALSNWVILDAVPAPPTASVATDTALTVYRPHGLGPDNDILESFEIAEFMLSASIAEPDFDEPGDWVLIDVERQFPYRSVMRQNYTVDETWMLRDLLVDTTAEILSITFTYVDVRIFIECGTVASMSRGTCTSFLQESAVAEGGNWTTVYKNHHEVSLDHNVDFFAGINEAIDHMIEMEEDSAHVHDRHLLFFHKKAWKGLKKVTKKTTNSIGEGFVWLGGEAGDGYKSAVKWLERNGKCFGISSGLWIAAAAADAAIYAALATASGGTVFAGYNQLQAHLQALGCKSSPSLSTEACTKFIEKLVNYGVIPFINNVAEIFGKKALKGIPALKIIFRSMIYTVTGSPASAVMSVFWCDIKTMCGCPCRVSNRSNGPPAPPLGDDDWMSVY